MKPLAWAILVSSLDHEPQLAGILALATLAQERLETLAQILGRRGGSTSEQRPLDVVAGDHDLFEAGQRFLNRCDELGRDRIRQGFRRKEALDQVTLRRFQQFEVRLNDRVI